jgi:hypothetical protein
MKDHTAITHEGSQEQRPRAARDSEAPVAEYNGRDKVTEKIRARHAIEERQRELGLQAHRRDGWQHLDECLRDRVQPDADAREHERWRDAEQRCCIELTISERCIQV